MKRAGPKLGNCIFCGSYGPITNEDAVPVWLMTMLAPAGFSWGRAPADWRSNLRPTQLGYRLKLPALCGPCNNAWLGPIEKQLKPRLSAWMAGVLSSMTADDQRLIAFWAVKTAMTVQLAHPQAQPVIPMTQYRELHKARNQPPRGFYVWAQVAPARFHGALFGTRPILDASAMEPAYEVSFDIRRLSLRIVGCHGVDGLRRAAAIAEIDGYARTMHQIWPTVSRFLLTA